jgi:hypothetical protein
LEAIKARDDGFDVSGFSEMMGASSIYNEQKVQSTLKPSD